MATDQQSIGCSGLRPSGSCHTCAVTRPPGGLRPPFAWRTVSFFDVRALALPSVFRTAAIAPLVLVVSSSPQGALAEGPALERLTVIAPGSHGGGWDLTARAMQDVLRRTGLVPQVEVANSPGAGGAIGLAEFVNARRGDGNALLVGGLVMISAVRANKAAVSLAQATPIARLTGDYEVIAVAAGSDVRDFADLAQAVRANPSAVSWGEVPPADRIRYC